MLKQFIAQTLDSLGDTPTLPVFVRSPSRGNMFLGLATTAQNAEALGVVAGLRCERITTSRLDGDTRRFYVLQ